MYKRIIVPITIAIILACSIAGAVPAEDKQEPSSPDLSHLDIADLMNLKVTSVAKKAGTVMDSAAAVYVITQDDIQRSGITTLPELLRLVPGMQVVRENSNKWAITARGFDNLYANKLLVMIDGRSIYTPTFSGVFWELQDMVLEDIDRIEVVRGPGATLWGANAMNAVINVVTKSSLDTTGGLFTLASETKPMCQTRFGGTMPGNGSYRVYAKGFEHQAFVDNQGNQAADPWNAGTAGFRMDWGSSPADAVTLEGAYFRADMRETDALPLYGPPYTELIDSDRKDRSGYLLFKRDRAESSRSKTTLQAYANYDIRLEPLTNSERCSTFDADFQRQDGLGGKHELIWSLGARMMTDKILGTDNTQMVPEKETTWLYSAFMQDDVRMSHNVRLTLGSKFEHNDYTGFELQPNVRALWNPSPNTTVWGAISKAARTPSRAENGVIFQMPGQAGPGGMSVIPTVFGNTDTLSEKLVAYELGLRLRPDRRVYLDITGYYDDYKDINNLVQGLPYVSMSPVPHLVVPVNFDNAAWATMHGIETAFNWDISDKWRVAGWHAWAEGSSHHRAADGSITVSAEDSTPRNQFHLRSSYDVSRRLKFNALFWKIDRIGAFFTTLAGSTTIPAYTRLDLNLDWKMQSGDDVVFGISNALDSSHQEGTSSNREVPTMVERSVYMTLNRWF